MPPTAPGRPPSDVHVPTGPPNTATWPPPLLDPEALADLPIPLQMVVVTALLPYEVAATSVRILRNTEALLGELVFHLNTLRPAVSGVSQAYAQGQFDQFFRTMDQIQQGTNAVALVWSPLTGLRDRLVPGAPAMAAAPPPAPRPTYAPRPAGPSRTRSTDYPPYPSPEPVTITPAPPSTIEYVGRLGGALLDQAAALPGAGWAASLPGAGWLRRSPVPGPSTEPLPAADRMTAPVAVPALGRSAAPTAVEPPERLSGPADDQEAEPTAAGRSLLGLAAPMVPGPVRRLLGGR